jgi:hypothetical protein
MDPSTRLLCVSAIAAVAGLGALDFVYGRYARNHFVPNTTMQRAEAAGTGCVVTLGDSRMAAGIDAPVLREGLRVRGIEVCIAPLAVGALPISGQAMALRRFIRDGQRPVRVILGASTGTLLDDDSPDPSALVGNRAAELAWSDASDVRLYYPGFPFADLDRGVRFSFARSNALSVYASATWIKTQTLQERLTGAGTRQEAHNRFGSLADMHALLSSFREHATKGLARWDGHYRLSRWFELVQRLVYETGARLTVVEVPMPSSYRADVVNSVAGRRYRAWLQGELARRGDTFLDMSAPQSVRDQHFEDGVHLDEDGARAFSGDLGEQLAALFAQRPTESHTP